MQLFPETAVRRWSFRSSQKFGNIHRKTPVLESLLNKVANIQGELTCTEWIAFQANPHLFQLTCPQTAVLET